MPLCRTRCCHLIICGMQPARLPLATSSCPATLLPSKWLKPISSQDAAFALAFAFAFASMYRSYSRLINRKSCANYRRAITFPQFTAVWVASGFFFLLLFSSLRFSKIVGTLVLVPNGAARSGRGTSSVQDCVNRVQLECLGAAIYR